MKQDIYDKCSCGRPYARQEGETVRYNLSGCNPWVEVGAVSPLTTYGSCVTARPCPRAGTRARSALIAED